jgi:hypothetical protein
MKITIFGIIAFMLFISCSRERTNINHEIIEEQEKINKNIEQINNNKNDNEQNLLYLEELGILDNLDDLQLQDMLIFMSNIEHSELQELFIQLKAMQNRSENIKNNNGIYNDINEYIFDDSIKIFRFDSTKIKHIQNINIEDFKLPDKDTYLTITNGNIFEYSYSIISSTNQQLNRHTVRINENREIPFYSYMGESGGGHTYAFFYFIDDKIIMRVEHIEYYGMNGRIELIFESLFIRE